MTLTISIDETQRTPNNKTNTNNPREPQRPNQHQTKQTHQPRHQPCAGPGLEALPASFDWLALAAATGANWTLPGRSERPDYPRPCAPAPAYDTPLRTTPTDANVCAHTFVDMTAVGWVGPPVRCGSGGACRDSTGTSGNDVDDAMTKASLFGFIESDFLERDLLEAEEFLSGVVPGVALAVTSVVVLLALLVMLKLKVTCCCC